MDFMDAVMEEEASVRAGETAGWEHGVKIGREQGLRLGNQRGAQLGAEVTLLTHTLSSSWDITWAA